MSARSATGDAAFPPISGGWWMVSLFSVAAILSYTDRQILNIIVDPIRADLVISDTQISLLQGAAFAVIYSVVGLPLGRVADVLARRWVIVSGVLLWSSATIACAYAASFEQLFAARVCVGIGEAALAPAAMSMIADAFPPARRGAAIGIFLMGMVIGAGAAFAVGGLLLEAAQNGAFAAWPLVGDLAPWRAVLFLVGAPGVLVALALASVREPERRSRLEGAGTHVLPFAKVLGEFHKRAAVLLPLYLALALLSIGDYALLSWSPALLTRKFQLSVGEVGTMLGLVAIATGILGTVGGGALSDFLAQRSGVRARIKVALVASLAGVAGAAVGLVGTSFEALVLLAAWMLISTITGVVGIATIQDLLPNEARGFGTSLISFGNTILGLGLGPTLVALATERIYGDPTAVGLAITTVGIPAAILSILLFWRALMAIPRADAQGDLA